MDYQEGFEDGVKFAREVIIANIRLWARLSAEVGFPSLQLGQPAIFNRVGERQRQHVFGQPF